MFRIFVTDNMVVQTIFLLHFFVCAVERRLYKNRLETNITTLQQILHKWENSIDVFDEGENVKYFYTEDGKYAKQNYLPFTKHDAKK